MTSPDPGQLHAAGPSPLGGDAGRTFHAFEQVGDFYEVPAPAVLAAARKP